MSLFVFEVLLYNIVLWYFYTFQNDHHDNLVTICHYTKILHIYWLHSTLYFIPVTHLFCSWKFVPLNLPHLLLSFPYPPASNHLFVLWIYGSVSILFVMCVHLFCFLDSTYYIHVVSNSRFNSFLWLSNISCVYIYLFIYLTSLSTHLLMDTYVASTSWLL